MDFYGKLVAGFRTKNHNTYQEVVSVEFVAGDPNDIEKIAAVTEEGMTRAQVRAFRENVFPLVKPFGDTGKKPTEAERKKIDETLRKAINAK